MAHDAIGGVRVASTWYPLSIAWLKNGTLALEMPGGVVEVFAIAEAPELAAALVRSQAAEQERNAGRAAPA